MEDFMFLCSSVLHKVRLHHRFDEGNTIGGGANKASDRIQRAQRRNVVKSRLFSHAEIIVVKQRSVISAELTDLRSEQEGKHAKGSRCGSGEEGGT